MGLAAMTSTKVPVVERLVVVCPVKVSAALPAVAVSAESRATTMSVAELNAIVLVLTGHSVRSKPAAGSWMGWCWQQLCQWQGLQQWYQ